MMPSETLHLYWGILHCHVGGALCHKKSGFSADEMAELSRQIDALYRVARDERGFDFLAYADHDSMGDMIRRGDVPGSPWRLVKEKARHYTAPGRFVPLLGYEYQDGMEYNVYLHGTEQLPMAPTWAQLMGQVAPGDPAILLAAHNRPSPTDWAFPVHENFRLIEILNEGSIFEGWAGEGLLRGHRAGFIGGSDDHGCRPGRNACTGVWAVELTADAIWEGLRARRTVAATGIRPALRMTVNGTDMGAPLDEADEFEAVLTHEFDRKPLAVMWISDGELIGRHTPQEAGFELRERWDRARLEGRRTLYAKLLYADGNVVFCSPVFLPESVTADGKRAAEEIALHGAAPAAAAPLRGVSCVEEFGSRIGWHNYINAHPLIPDSLRPMQQIRDMVVHTGPDPLLVCTTGEMVAGTMEGIVAFDTRRAPRMLHEFSDGPEHRLITSLVELGEVVAAAGYFGDQPEFVTLRGETPGALSRLKPMHPYFYRDRFVTPRYLASDGIFLCCLAEREATVTLPGGKVIAFCQAEYPAFPCAVDMAGLECMVVLGCDGTVVCYDAAASQSAVVRWRIRLPEARSGVTIMDDEVWCYNRSFHGCYSRDPIEIAVINRRDGSFKGVLRPELVNIRGTTIRPLAGARFAALHNPTLNGAAAFRNELNVAGTVRVYETA